MEVPDPTPVKPEVKGKVLNPDDDCGGAGCTTVPDGDGNYIKVPTGAAPNSLSASERGYSLSEEQRVVNAAINQDETAVAGSISGVIAEAAANSAGLPKPISSQIGSGTSLLVNSIVTSD